MEKKQSQKNSSKDTSVHLCDKCNKRFRTDEDLVRHNENKHEAYECGRCNQLFVSKK